MKLTAILSFPLLLATAIAADVGGEGSIRGLAGISGGGSIGPISGSFRACFSEVSTVQVHGKGTVPMKELQVGDLLLTGEGSYKPVYAFGHLDRDSKATFLQLQTESSTLEITGEHMVFVDNKSSPVRADTVQVGDVLQGSVVKRTTSIERTGLYAPFTESGTLMVDGIKASSYISVQEDAKDSIRLLSDQNLAHVMLSPFRMMCMGVSSELCQNYNEDGVPPVIAFGLKLSQYCNSLNALAQLLLLSTLLLMAGAFMIVESVFGATFAPTALLGLVLMFGMLKASSKANNMSIRGIRKVKTV